jgi:hypothetical protein
MPKVHVVASYGDLTKGIPRIHHNRPDLGALFNILAALQPLGYDPAGIIFNFPPPNEEVERYGGLPPLLPIDESAFRKRDLICWLGRPPQDDNKKEHRIRSERAFTTIEDKILDVCRQHFELLRRPSLRLTPEYAERLREPYQNRADVQFKMHGPFGWYKSCSRLNGTQTQKFSARDQRTAAYLLHIPEVPTLSGRPGVLIPFGPSGLITLGWTHRLRTDHAHLLREPGFTVVEISNVFVPERPTSLRFVDDWQIEIVLHEPPRVPVARRPRLPHGSVPVATL